MADAAPAPLLEGADLAKVAAGLAAQLMTGNLVILAEPGPQQDLIAKAAVNVAKAIAKEVQAQAAAEAAAAEAAAAA